MKTLLTCLSFTLSLAHAAVAVPAGIDHAPFDKLLQTYVDAKGLVNYAAWKKNPEDLRALESYLAQFAPAADKAAEGHERVAALINAYNAFTLRFILENYPTESIRTLKKPFDEKRNRIGGEWVSVDDIEHRALRPEIGWKVHALVVCAARSCPPLHNRAFTAETWENLVGERYRAWLARADLNTFDAKANEVRLSKIFDWYAKDFRDGDSVLELLRRFAPESERAWLRSANPKLRHLPYHWGLNDQGDRGKTYKHGWL